ncbi:MAG TPA: patatin-like phospholipase family protein [Bacteroidales bacterium]|nr:patatin-like phospholipase family protein [Bacteroidales bacterium]
MKTKVSLALSGGGARGLAHIGVIEELEDKGFEISAIAGTSMGALVGGVYAAGKMPEFKEWMLTLDKVKILRLVDFSFSTQGLIKGDRVFSKMNDYISEISIEDLKIPYAAVAVDLLEKREVVFTKGSIYKAIRASVSIPSVFTPVKKDKTLLVDGGVLNNIPVNHVKRMPGDILIAVDVNANIPPVKPEISEEDDAERQGMYMEKMQLLQKHLRKMLPGNSKAHMGYFDLMNETISLMTNTISSMILEKHPPDLLIRISRQSAGTFDFYKAEELIEIGHMMARDALDAHQKKHE